MRYLIYEPDAIDAIHRDLAKIDKKDAAPWRRCPTQESAAQVVRSRYPDAMPGPYETADDGKRTPVLLVWEMARAMADGQPPVLIVEPEPEHHADEKQLKRYRKGDRSAAPFDQAIWTRGVVLEPAHVLYEREAKARFTGFIGEIDTKVRVGTARDGRSGLWFEVAGYGPFSVAVREDHEIVLRRRDDPGAVTMPNSVTIPLKLAGELGIFEKLRQVGYQIADTPSEESSDEVAVREDEAAKKLRDQATVAPEIEPPFHQLFRRTDLAPNVDYVRRYRPGDDDTMRVLVAAEADYKARGLTFDAYMGKKNASGSALLDWYANGEAPEPRPGMVALFHPQYHKRDWEKTANVLTAMAKALERWIWVCECEESRWVMAMVGDPPPSDGEDADGHPAWERHVRYSDRGSDQYIAAIAPSGEWKMLGLS